MANYDTTEVGVVTPEDDVRDLRQRYGSLQSKRHELAVHLRAILMKECSRLERECKEITDILSDIEGPATAPEPMGMDWR